MTTIRLSTAVLVVLGLAACVGDEASDGLDRSADHPYGEFYAVAGQPGERACSDVTCSGPNVRLGSFGGGGYCPDTNLYEVQMVNCGDAPVEHAFTVALNAGDTPETSVVVKSFEVPAGLPGGHAVWGEFIVTFEEQSAVSRPEEPVDMGVTNGWVGWDEDTQDPACRTRTFTEHIGGIFCPRKPLPTE